VGLLVKPGNRGFTQWNSTGVHDSEPGLGGGDSGGVGIGCDYAHVLDTDLLEIERGFLGLVTVAELCRRIGACKSQIGWCWSRSV